MSRRLFGFMLAEDDRRLLTKLASLERRKLGDTLRVCLRETAHRRGVLDEASFVLHREDNQIGEEGDER